MSAGAKRGVPRYGRHAQHVGSGRVSVSDTRTGPVGRGLVPELHEDPRCRVFLVDTMARDLDEPGALPRADSTLVPRVRIDSHALAAALVEQVTGHGPC